MNVFDESFLKDPLQLRPDETLIFPHAFGEHRLRINENLVLDSSQDEIDIHKVDKVLISDLSNFAKAAQDFLTPNRIEDYLIYCKNPNIINYLKLIRDNGYLDSIDLSCYGIEYVYHSACNLYVDSDGALSDKLETLKLNRVYGSQTRVSYFSVDPAMALSHGIGNYNYLTQRRSRFLQSQILFLKISVEKLEQQRNIFIDPESLTPPYWDSEFGKNFVVHSGIPISAIEGILRMDYIGSKEK